MGEWSLEKHMFFLVPAIHKDSWDFSCGLDTKFVYYIILLNLIVVQKS